MIPQGHPTTGHVRQASGVDQPRNTYDEHRRRVDLASMEVDADVYQRHGRRLPVDHPESWGWER